MGIEWRKLVIEGRCDESGRYPFGSCGQIWRCLNMRGGNGTLIGGRVVILVVYSYLCV